MSTEVSGAPRRRPKDRREQIVLRAREMFVEVGYPNVTMAALAERLGVTAGSMYRHFATKGVLLERVLDDGFGFLDEPIGAASVDEAVDRAIRIVSPHPHAADLWDRELRYAEPAVRERHEAAARAWAAGFGPALRARRPELDDGNVALLAWALRSVLACLGTTTIHAPAVEREAAVRAAMHAVAAAPLGPTAIEPPAPPEGRVPVSRRERLLLAAVAQFAERGYQETSMASIGAAADVTGPNLYAYFPSKAALLRAVYERGTHQLWIGLDAALAGSTGPADALRRVLAAYARHVRAAGSMDVGRSGEREVEEESLDAQREYVNEWIALVQQVDPRVGPVAARLRVQVAVKLVGDLLGSPYAARTSGSDAVESIAYAVLSAGT